MADLLNRNVVRVCTGCKRPKPTDEFAPKSWCCYGCAMAKEPQLMERMPSEQLFDADAVISKSCSAVNLLQPPGIPDVGKHKAPQTSLEPVESSHGTDTSPLSPLQAHGGVWQMAVQLRSLLSSSPMPFAPPQSHTPLKDPLPSQPDVTEYPPPVPDQKMTAMISQWSDDMEEEWEEWDPSEGGDVTPEIDEAEINDLLAALGKHLDSIVTATSVSGRFLSRQPHLVGFCNAVLVLSWLYSFVPHLFGLLLGLVPLLMHLQPGVASPITHMISARNLLQRICHALDWMTTRPLLILISLFPIFSLIATSVLNPALHHVGPADSVWPWQTSIPPWTGLILGLGSALLWISHSRENAAGWSLLYSMLLYAVVTVQHLNYSNLPLLLLAIIFHVGALTAPNRNHREPLAICAAISYASFLYFAGLDPWISAMLLKLLRMLHVPRLHPLELLKRMFLRALPELPGAILFVMGVWCAWQGQQKKMPIQGFYYAASALFFTMALMAWDIIEVPEFIFELLEAILGILLYIYQAIQDSMNWSLRLPKLLLYLIVDFIYFLFRIPGALFHLIIAIPLSILRFIFRIIGWVLLGPKEWLKHFIAHYFWMLEHFLQHWANISGAIAQALS